MRLPLEVPPAVLGGVPQAVTLFGAWAVTTPCVLTRHPHRPGGGVLYPLLLGVLGLARPLPVAVAVASALALLLAVCFRRAQLRLRNPPCQRPPLPQLFASCLLLVMALTLPLVLVLLSARGAAGRLPRVVGLVLADQPEPRWPALLLLQAVADLPLRLPLRALLLCVAQPPRRPLRVLLPLAGVAGSLPLLWVGPPSTLRVLLVALPRRPRAWPRLRFLLPEAVAQRTLADVVVRPVGVVPGMGLPLLRRPIRPSGVLA